MISVLSIVHDTMVDGPGFRTSIYCAGCPNHCPGCHNPQSWDISHGTMTSTDELMKEIMSDPFANVTFSGGDPMFQAKGFAELARAIREQSSKSIWCFTGYLFENLVKNPEQLELLRQIDVLVDGPFVQALRDEDLFFRGSSNQRIINVQKSLKEGRVIELNLTTENSEYNHAPTRFRAISHRHRAEGRDPAEHLPYDKDHGFCVRISAPHSAARQAQTS